MNQSLVYIIPIIILLVYLSYMKTINQKYLRFVIKNKKPSWGWAVGPGHIAFMFKQFFGIAPPAFNNPEYKSLLRKKRITTLICIIILIIWYFVR